ncbi:MAG TPA: hypothetical protein VM821_06620, partial [Abditibacteriaceae bacterium]|nr:hypothetical protein [Abditibacteriaceae bacterium]
FVELDALHQGGRAIADAHNRNANLLTFHLHPKPLFQSTHFGAIQRALISIRRTNIINKDAAQTTTKTQPHECTWYKATVQTLSEESLRYRVLGIKELLRNLEPRLQSLDLRSQLTLINLSRYFSSRSEPNRATGFRYSQLFTALRVLNVRLLNRLAFDTIEQVSS